MAVPVLMPKQGQSVESCIITKWNKQVGDAVAVGEVIFSYETDKSSFEEEAKTSGTMLVHFFEEGDDVECLTNVCVIGDPGEDYSAFAPKGAAAAEEAAPAAAPAPAPQQEAPASAAAAPVRKEGYYPVLMPKQGQSVESCIITEWKKKPGDTVKVGDVLFSYETDKASFEEESKYDGTLLGVFFDEGDDVECLTTICVIGPAGGSCDEYDPKKGAAAPAAAVSAAPAAAAAAPAAAPAAVVRAEGEKLKISPRARNAAAKAGVNPAFAAGSGPDGRIIERDIIGLIGNKDYATFAAAAEAKAGMTGTGLGGRISTADIEGAASAPAAKAPAAAAAAAPEADYVDEPVSNMRKVISKAMMGSLQGMAQLTLNSSFDATEIMAFRKKIKDNAEALGLGKITVTDIILYAVSRTLLNHKFVNANMLDDKMRFFNNAHVGLAVDTPRGLLVPTIFNANKMSLNEIAAESKTLAAAAQGGTISPDLLKGASFTVTNLGTFGVESFTPVINPPQTCILGVNTIVQRVKEVNGQLTTYPAMGLSLTFDHRALDGAPAARFLKELVTNLENITVLMAK